MRLTSIQACNFKGSNFAHALAPITVFTGPNDAGKSTRLEAATLLLAGYLPTIKKTAQEIFKLSSGDMMFVDGTLDGIPGQHSRTWLLRGSTVTATSKVGPEISRLHPVLIDPSLFFEASARARNNMIAELAGASSGDPGAFAPTELLSTLHVHLGPNIPKNLKMLLPITDKTPQEWLLAIIELVKGWKSNCEADQRRLAGTIATMAEIPSTGSGDGAAIDAEIGRLEKAIQEEISTQWRLDEEISTAKANVTRRNELQAKLRELRANGDPQALLKQIEELQDQIDASTPNTEKAGEVYASERVAKHDLKNLETSLEQTRETLLDLEKEGLRIGKMKCCPTCKAAGSSWKSSLMEELMARTKSVKKEEAALEKQIEKFARGVATASKAARAMEDTVTKHNELVEQQAKLSREYQALAGTIKETAKLKAELAAIKTPIDTKPLEKSLEESRAKSTGLDTQLAGLKAKRRDITQARVIEGNRATTAQSLTQAEADHEQYKAALKWLEATLARVVEQSIGKLLATANQLCGEILKSPLCYCDGEIGRMQAGRFIAHWTFDGSEKALTYAALSVAIGSQSPCRIVIMDELGRLDTLRKGMLMGTLSRLIEEKVIDQFLGADVNSDDHERIGGKLNHFSHIKL